MSSQGLSAYKNQIGALHRELGIAGDYAQVCGLELQPECDNLVETELDVFSRQPLMEARAYQAWQEMKVAADLAGIKLFIISAYRSAAYQQGLLLKKVAQGQSLQSILRINAAPGYSEHHTGKAIDIGSPDYEHLHEVFEESPAFAWLNEHASAYGFSLSFPRNNSAGMLYEPWHWKFSCQQQ